MTRRLLAVLVAGALVAAPAVASAQLSTAFSLAGGLAVPTGDLANGVKSGYNVAAGLDLGAPVIPFGVRVEVGYNSFSFKTGTAIPSGSLNILSGTANAVLSLMPGIISPYVIGGLGMYRQSASCSGCTSTSETNFGFNGGGGIKFGLGGLSTFAEIRYHAIPGDKAKGTNAQFIPLTFGVSF